jgi:hypothetical protein
MVNTMDLTPELKAQIDNMSYFSMLSGWRYAPSGDPMFQGESFEYYRDRMQEMRKEPGGHERHVAASKALG